MSMNAIMISKDIIKFIFQITVLLTATEMGWKICEVDNNRLIISKNLKDLDDNDKKISDIIFRIVNKSF